MKTPCTVGSTAAMWFAWSAAAQATFSGLGVMTQGDWSIANAISADGGVVVGVCRTFPTPNSPVGRAFRWTAKEGMVDLGSLIPGLLGVSEAFGISGDGSIVVGETDAPTGCTGLHAAWWTAATRWVDLTPEPECSGASLTWIAPDGSFGLGNAFMSTSPGSGYRAPILWRPPGWGFLASMSEAYGATADGSIVLGAGAVGGVLRLANGTIQPLPVPPGQNYAIGYGMTPDGAVIVGASRFSACAWFNGKVSLLPSVYGPTFQEAHAVSDDGRVIVGTARYNATTRDAVLWTSESAPQYVRDVLEQAGLDLHDWNLQEAVGISGDGRTIIGNGSHWLDPQLGVVRSEGWVATLPSWVGCYANCDGSSLAPVLNAADFVCFQSRFVSGESYANCDGSTALPVLNINDFVCFMQRFAAGCP